MKRYSIIVLFLIVVIPSIAKNKHSDRAENAKVVLGNIAQMIGQIGNIIENPHNADNIETSVTNLVNNIVKITVHAVNNKSISRNDGKDIVEQLQQLCKDRDLICANDDIDWGLL